jgi:dUTP pyrophosphatase
MTTPVLEYVKTSQALHPVKAHETDACYDIFVDLSEAPTLKSNALKGMVSPNSNAIDFSLESKEIPIYPAYNGTLYVDLPPMSVTIIPTGLFFNIPDGYRVDIRSRSGRSTTGQFLANGVGTIDQDYRDEIKVILFNFGLESRIHQGDKIAQMMLCSSEPSLTQSVLSEYNRGTSLPWQNSNNRGGGLGSTGN